MPPPPPVSKAAADRLAKGIVPGDLLLFGEHVNKARVLVESSDRNHSPVYLRTRVPFVGRVVEVTPSGRFRVESIDGDHQFRTQLLSARDSLRAIKMTPEQIERRSTVLHGWE